MSVGARLRSALRDPSRLITGAKGRVVSLKKQRLDLTTERQKSIVALSERFAIDARSLLVDYQSSAFSRVYQLRKRQLQEEALLSEGDLTSDFDCITMYLVVRAAKPHLVVETGSFQGGFTAHILQAMEENGAGFLHSVDLPKQGRYANQEGALIPDELRGRWRLHLGDSKIVLPTLVRDLDPINLFHHDSLHTFRHMVWEFETVYPQLASGGVMTSHDVLAPPLFPSPFTYFCNKKSMPHGIFRNLGVAYVHDQRTRSVELQGSRP